MNKRRHSHPLTLNWIKIYEWKYVIEHNRFISRKSGYLSSFHYTFTLYFFGKFSHSHLTEQFTDFMLKIVCTICYGYYKTSYFSISALFCITIIHFEKRWFHWTGNWCGMSAQMLVFSFWDTITLLPPGVSCYRYRKLAIRPLPVLVSLYNLHYSAHYLGLVLIYDQCLIIRTFLLNPSNQKLWYDHNMTVVCSGDSTFLVI